jgi:hypothetical protein
VPPSESKITTLNKEGSMTDKNASLVAHEKETDILGRIDSEVFFTVLETHKVDLTHFYLDKRNLNPQEVMKLNKALLDCNNEHGLKILDCLAVLERDYFTVAKIMDLLSDKVRKTLRRELKAYAPHMKMPYNTLSTFFSTK